MAVRAWFSAAGPDWVPARLLREISDTLARTLTYSDETTIARRGDMAESVDFKDGLVTVQLAGVSPGKRRLMRIHRLTAGASP